MSISFPMLVLVQDSGELLRFDSIAEMQHHLERIDVENEEYLAWESSGHPVTMTVEEPLWLKLESRAEKPDTAGLFSALQRFAESRGVKLQAGDQNTTPLALYEKIVAQSPRTEKGVLGKLFKSHRRG
jgi:hypothetical protein